MATRKDDKTIALVAHGGISARQWRLESVIPRELKPDEVLVRIVASGICQADLHFGDGDAERINSSSIWYPRVLGHEGSGYVEKIGSSVKDLEVSDPVILSFNSCGTCSNCLEGEAGYCDSFKQCNFVGEQGVYQMEHEPEVQIGASFFGQSSFASRAIVKERCVVNVARFKLSYEKLCLLAPLGCGIQTGSGALVNTAAVRAGQSVAVIGVGGVGQSAIMVRNASLSQPPITHTATFRVQGRSFAPLQNHYCHRPLFAAFGGSKVFGCNSYHQHIRYRDQLSGGSAKHNLTSRGRCLTGHVWNCDPGEAVLGFRALTRKSCASWACKAS